MAITKEQEDYLRKLEQEKSDAARTRAARFGRFTRRAVAPSSAPLLTGTWPTGWDDPRFAANTTSGDITTPGVSNPTVYQNLTIDSQSGNPCIQFGYYTFKNCRYRGREGPRVSDSDCIIDGCYLELNATDINDHADGIQGFGGSGPQADVTNIVIRNTYIKNVGSVFNCGIFFADFIGAHLTIENCLVDGRSAAGGVSSLGAIYLPCSPTDIGVKSLAIRNVGLFSDTTGPFANRFISFGSNPELCNITEWTNVYRADTGAQIPRP